MPLPLIRHEQQAIPLLSAMTPERANAVGRTGEEPRVPGTHVGNGSILIEELRKGVSDVLQSKAESRRHDGKRRKCKEKVPLPEEIDPRTPLAHYGMEQIDLVNLAFYAEDHTGEQLDSADDDTLDPKSNLNPRCSADAITMRSARRRIPPSARSAWGIRERSPRRTGKRLRRR